MRMNYLDDVEKQLRKRLAAFEIDAETETIATDIIGFVRTKLLESYKNGAQAARKQMDKRSSQSQNKSSKDQK